nr:ADP-ribosylglycohydrolase family protein [Paludisphaera soli]
MRVGPVAWAFETLAEVLKVAKETARVTHDHPEGVKGAQATAAAIFLARSGAAKWEIREEVERRFQYDLSFRLDDVRPFHVFDSSCQGTVPQALVAFLESEDYETAVRLAVSLGGDCDTLACIAGAVAAAFHGGVPGPIREQALDRLDDDLAGVVAAFEARFPPSAG